MGLAVRSAEAVAFDVIELSGKNDVLVLRLDATAIQLGGKPVLLRTTTADDLRSWG